MKENEKITTAEPHLVFTPERKVLDSDTAKTNVSRCSDYNDSRREARNFKCVEIRGMKFNGEDLAGIEASYAKFADCEFTNCKFSRMEAYFASFENCTFIGSDLENGNFSFADITDTVFANCNLNGADFPFARGNFSCNGCMMERASANNSNLMIELTNTNAHYFEANFAVIRINTVGSSLRRAEFNDGKISGNIQTTDLTGAELNRSDLSDLHIMEGNATHNIETEDAVGFSAILETDFSDIDYED